MANFDKLKALYAKLDTLSSASSTTEVDSLGDFFSDDCVTYLSSMREYDEPSIGKLITVEKYRESLKILHVHERRIISHSTTADGRTVFFEMKNAVHCFEELLDPFFETAIATFDENGLIKELKHYSCRSHIVEIIQKYTGEGPYGEVPETRGQKVSDAPCCG